MIPTTHVHRTPTWQRFGAAMLCCCVHTAFSEPFRPTSDDTVLLTLRAPLPRTITHSDNDPTTAVRIASELIELGRSQQDERYFGYASAALKAWDGSNAPTPVAILRADIAQHQHRFGDAIEILDALIARDPNHARARLMRASLHVAQGRPQLAKRDCQRLFALRESFAATVCIAQSASLNGQLDSSYRLLADLLHGASSADDRYTWALGIAAEMAERRGDFAAAEQWLRKALMQSPNDAVSQLQLADVLLKRQQPELALATLKSAPDSEPTLLRRALAHQQIGDRRQFSAALTAWTTAANTSRQLGVTLHLRELALGQLYLLDDPKRALTTALANWQVQREPIDARLLAAAARANMDEDVLRTVREWRDSLDLEDAGLTL